MAMEQSSQELYKEKSQWPWNSLVKRSVQGEESVAMEQSSQELYKEKSQ